MRDIWNPWHGCKKISEGCQHCYMYFLDEQRGACGSDIFRVQNNFDYPLHRDLSGNFKIKSGEFLMVCMTSDFFLAEADQWRPEVWNIIKRRSDVVFILVTKRPERIADHLPPNWGDGWNNVWCHITAENQRRADERIPIFLKLPFKHKGIMVAPFIGPMSIAKYLAYGNIENVWCGGENYAGARPLYCNWVRSLSDECKSYDVSFSFFETGNVFIDQYGARNFVKKSEQKKVAFLCNLNYESTKPQKFDLENFQIQLFDHPKSFKEGCQYCTKRKFCAGCSNCGKCD